MKVRIVDTTEKDSLVVDMPSWLTCAVAYAMARELCGRRVALYTDRNELLQKDKSLCHYYDEDGEHHIYAKPSSCYNEPDDDVLAKLSVIEYKVDKMRLHIIMMMLVATAMLGFVILISQATL